MTTITLNALDTANRSDLVDIWETTFGSAPPPNSSQDMMRLIVGWEVQVKTAQSDLRALKAAIRKVVGPGKARRPTLAPIVKPKAVLSPGTGLSRDWQRRIYIIDVLDKGYAYDGRLYTSLTPIAKTITGSHRSGPLFFGVSK